MSQRTEVIFNFIFIVSSFPSIYFKDYGFSLFASTNELKAYDDNSKIDKFLQTEISESFERSALKSQRDFALFWKRHFTTVS